MSSNFGRYGRKATHDKKARTPDGGFRILCTVCGRPLDIFHNAEVCRDKFLKEQDAAGNPSNTRHKP